MIYLDLLIEDSFVRGSIQDIRSIFKTILAGERLTMGGGYIASSIDNGLVLDLLKRLKEIRDDMD